MESNSHNSRNDAQTDVLDRAIEAALAKYSSVEPRTGLEGRILAHLRSPRERIPTRSWWQWSAAAAVAALLVIVIAFVWTWSRPAKMVQQQRSTPIESVPPSATQVAFKSGIKAASALRPKHKATQHSVPQPVAAANAPKLDQFPSPRPLSTQEKLALEYIERFPRQASLIAQAQTNSARQQEIAEMQGQRNSQ
jgi:hypothetical protein